MEQPNSIVIANGRVLTSGRVLERGTVIVKGNRIADVREAPCDGEAGALLDAHSWTILPGLIDIQSTVELATSRWMTCS